jgi:hypothetical protein
MRIELIPAFLLPAGMIFFGVLMLRQREGSGLSTQNRTLAARLAILAGLGWLEIGVVRLATRS